MTAAATKFRLIFRVPPHAADACKTAIFNAGAGCYPGPGQYTECCFSSLGTGQFRPGDTANPNVGSVGKLEHTPEMRIETLCVGEDVVRRAVEALKKRVSPLPSSCSFCFLLTSRFLQSPSLRGAGLRGGQARELLRNQTSGLFYASACNCGDGAQNGGAIVENLPYGMTQDK